MRKCFSIKRKSYSIETKYQVVEMKVDEYNLKHFLNILENIRKDIELEIKRV